MKITDIKDVTVVTDFIKHGIGRIKVGCSRCTHPSILFSSQDHGRLPAEHISKHSEKDSR